MKRVKALLQRVGPLVILLPTLCIAACAGNPTPLADESWLPMPTRIPTPTAVMPTQILKEMEPALLAGNPEEATAIWERAADMAPDHPTVLREGARLALALGDLETATSRAWLAVIAAPQDATAWALLGIIQQRQGEITLSQQSLSTAQALDPELEPTLFPARWQAARRAGDAKVLTELARAYLLIHPQDPLTLYYRTEALLATGYTEEAMNLLLMRMDEESSAVLWYTLARAYLDYGAEEEARIALETALRGHARGDDTLLLASDDPLHDLSKLLGEIYLETGRCEEAVMRLELLVTPYPDLASLVEEAHRCPTPAPTVTPWLPQDWATGP